METKYDPTHFVFFYFQTLLLNLTYEEGSDSVLRFGRLRVGLCVDDQGVRVGTVRDPKLGPVQHVVVLQNRECNEYCGKSHFFSSDTKLNKVWE